MDISLFEYKLPNECIAHTLSEPRDAAKLLVLNRESGAITHSHFYDLPNFLKKGDVLVFNQTKVFPARIYGKKETGGKVEVLLLNNLTNNTWEILGKNIPGVNEKIYFDGMQALVIKKSENETILSFNKSQLEVRENLIRIGSTPLPPYIHSSESELSLRQKYQTVYAKTEGSVAAPTAGLHFTDNLFNSLREKGIQIEFVTLHVGAGTFLPIKETDITKHKMHSEIFSIDDETIDRLNNAKKLKSRIISVGTTTTRVLETLSNSHGVLTNTLNGETNIYIYPPFKFKFVDGLITNFHLPHSTLLALVSAFVTAPNTNHVFTSFNESIVGVSYREAIDKNYKFFSFGDGMLIYG